MSVGGGLHFTTPSIYNVPKVMQAFRDGGGVCNNEIGDEVFEGTERFFRPGCIHFLAKDWIGALPGMSDRLARGAAVADVRCGRGQSTVANGASFQKFHSLGSRQPRSEHRVCAATS